MDASLEMVMSTPSPLKDRSNEAGDIPARKGRRSRGGDEKPRRPSSGGEEKVSSPKPSADSTMMSFDEMKNQLSLWQCHLSELSAEHVEAQKLRQDSTCLRSKLSSCEEEASERARRLVEVRVQVQEQAKELAETQGKLNKKFIEVAQEKEVTEKQAKELKELHDELKDAQRRQVALEAETAALRAELTAERVQASRQKVQSSELEEELAQASQAAMAAERKLQAQDVKITEMQQLWEAQQEEVQEEREQRLVVAKEAEEDILLHKRRVEDLERELCAARETCAAERSMARTAQANLAEAMKFEAELQVMEDQKLALEDEVATLRHDLQSMSELQREELGAMKTKADDLSAQLEVARHEREEAQRKVLEDMERQMEAQKATLQRELEAEREHVLLQRDQIQELQGAVADGKHSLAALASQHQEEVQALESTVTKVKEALEVEQKQSTTLAKELQTERAEVERLSSLESSLRLALEGHCQQLAEAAREQSELRSRLQQLEQEQAAGKDRQEDLELQLQGAAEASGAQAHLLRSEAKQLTDALEEARQEARLWQERAEVLVRRRKAASAAASRWEGADAAWDWLMEQGEGAQEVAEMPEGSELRLQNRELCLSLRQFTQDCELLEAENLSLKEALNIAEEDLDRVSDQHAQLMGHTNHRQKIRYTMKLKEENNRLCTELKRARQRIVQLEVNKESESLLEALASVTGTALVPERSSPGSVRRRLGGVLVTPRTPAARPATKRTPGSAGGVSCKAVARGPAVDDFEDQMRLDEVERRSELQRHALERISVDFQHLKALIERAVSLADTERRNGVNGGNFAALLQRLRDIIAANHRRSAASSKQMPYSIEELPVPATPIHGHDDDEELIAGEAICYVTEKPPAENACEDSN